MRASDALRAAKQLVLTKGTKGQYARDAQGMYVRDLQSPRACMFCAAGAVGRVTEHSLVGGNTTTPEFVYLRQAAEEILEILYNASMASLGSGYFLNAAIFIINDTYPEHVAAMFDRAIELAQRAERTETTSC